MKLYLIKIGKPAMAEAGIIAAEYLKRIKAFQTLESMELKESQAKGALEKLPPGTKLIFCDEKGKAHTTKSLTAQMTAWMDDPATKAVAFVIGGPYGFTDEIRKLPHTSITLSGLTFQGDLAWIVLCEQIYRVFTILKGMDYHHK